MNNKTLVGLVILIILFLGGILFIFSNRQPPKETQSQAVATITPTPTIFTLKEITVTLTNSGFSPKTITIKKGEGIIWLNKSGVKATINSADHPTHKKFPEMNLGEFDNDQTITHVFTKAGTYEYHNHYSPQETGVVVVK